MVSIPDTCETVENLISGISTGNRVNTMIGNVKRAIHGTYHSVSSKHLPRYLAEFSFRFNNRFHMGSMIDRILKQATQTNPLPDHRLKLAEEWG